jgi:hypothetical protein
MKYYSLNDPTPPFQENFPETSMSSGNYRQKIIKELLNIGIGAVQSFFATPSENLKLAIPHRAACGECHYGTFWEHPAVCIELPVDPSGAIATAFW